MRAGNPTLYDGDAGTAWVCAELGVLLGRDDLVELAQRVMADTSTRAAQLPAGLLTGRAGVGLAQKRIEVLTGSRTAESLGVDLGWDGTPPGSADLTSGVAGLLVGDLTAAQAETALLLLERSAHGGPGGYCWPEPEAPDPLAGRPLCGLAHGNSGVVWALAETAARYEALAPRAGELIREALRWERSWFDPVRGRWPDLRTVPPSHPALWCHGAAGIGAVRLRLLALSGQGLELGLPLEELTAEAELAVQACGQVLADSVQLAQAQDPAALAGGLTLCHGLGGPLDVLLSAHRLWEVPEHLAAARSMAVAVADLLGQNPLDWPSGLSATGGSSLFLGLGGAALVLARAAYPDRIGSPALLGIR
nr:lanthionine synthetase LanC family protein [Microlunatus panaciterrae]